MTIPDKPNSTLEDITNPNGRREELVKKFVKKIIPDGKDKTRWYLNLDENKETIIDAVIDGKRKNAIININEEEPDKAPLPVHKGDIYTIEDLKALSKREAIQIIENTNDNTKLNLWFSFKIDFEEAYAYRKRHGQYLRKYNYDPLLVEVFI